VQAVHTLRIEPWTHLAQLAEASCQQRGADHQPHRRSHLRHHQQIAHPRSSARARVAAREVRHRCAQSASRRLERGPHADEHGNRRERDQGADEDRPVHTDVLDTRDTGRQLRHEHGGHPYAAEQSKRTTDDEHGDQLADRLHDQSCSRRAERRPHGQLTLSHQRPRHQQIGQVGAADEEHRRDAASRMYSDVFTVETVSSSIGTTSAPMPLVFFRVFALDLRESTSSRTAPAPATRRASDAPRADTNSSSD
jgi:hypothetical protein